jgi:hypothetical protein
MLCIHYEMLTAVNKHAYGTIGKQAERYNAVCFAQKRKSYGSNTYVSVL